LGIAQKLGIRVVAEGIETESQAQQLSDFGCSLGQGFLFSPGVDSDRMTEMLLRFAQLPDGIPEKRGFPRARRSDQARRSLRAG
jgi:predicted signal transduction protein with EAL and GGDEF domain